MFESTWSISMFGCFFVIFLNQSPFLTGQCTQKNRILQSGEPGKTPETSFAMEVITGGELTGAFYVGFLDGLLGVAGMIIHSWPVDHSRKAPA
jgi:uncharacterized membrane protein YfcA